MSIDLFCVWRSYYNQQKQIPLSVWKPEKLSPKNRLIAFPLHLEDPPHFTLGVLVLIDSVDSGSNDSDERTDWVLLHFDSSPCSPRSKELALEYGKFVLGLDDDKDIEYLEAPVIHQEPGSNDCGFYPAHFLNVILVDIDGSMEIIREVGI